MDRVASVYCYAEPHQLEDDVSRSLYAHLTATVMPRYRVFLGAPSAKDIAQGSEATRRWQHFSSTPTSQSVQPSQDFEAASRRISKLYENVIFNEDSDGYMSGEDDNARGETTGQAQGTTFITWPPTDMASTATGANNEWTRTRDSTFRHSLAAVTGRQLETQETQETGSFDYSDASSIARFPSFHFSLHTLTPLSSLHDLLSRQRIPQQSYGSQVGIGSVKLNILVAILEVEGPDTIRMKRGLEVGKEVSLLKIIVADEDGAICKLVAWRDTAEKWGGSYTAADAIKRGDIVHFQNVKLSHPAGGGPSDALTLTASPALSSTMTICFRTMPFIPGETRYRPDLRLGHSDAAVRKVSAAVAWFETMAGLPTTNAIDEREQLA